jgi:exopolysaccharide production protein ExoQ
VSMQNRPIRHDVLSSPYSGEGSDASQPNALLRGLFAIAILFQLGGAFSFQLTSEGDTRSPSRLLQVISILQILFAGIVILSSSPRSRRALQKCWPLFALYGLAVTSTIWSSDPSATFKASLAFAQSILLGLALASSFGPAKCLPFVIRVMSFGCFLSIVWVFIFPETAVHQAGTVVGASQSQHAGLWRGVFTHKQGLGTFSGFTLALLLFYGSSIFRSTILRLSAIACALICLLGSGSATGIVIVTTSTLLLYVTHWISQLPPMARRSALYQLVVAFSLVLFAFSSGVLRFIPALMGKDSDLTGRTYTWWLAQDNFSRSGMTLFGGGLANNGFILSMSDDQAIDNGFLLKLLEFGYVGSLIIYSILLWIAFTGIDLICRTNPRRALIDIFPINLIMTLTVYSLTETGLMEKHILTILMSISVFIIISARGFSGAGVPRSFGYYRSASPNRGKKT